MKKFLALFVLLSGPVAHAFPFKCDKEQTRCEVQTRRLTVGDKVGIFNTGRQLVAIGEVQDIDGTKRVVKITKRWALLLKSDEIEIISDNNYKTPETAFSVVTPLAQRSWAAQLGIVNLGIGDGFLATEVSGLFFKHFKRDYSWIGRIHYLTGSGEASDNLGGAGSQSVDVSSFGVSGGVSQMLMPHSIIAPRLDAELGVGYAAVTLNGDFDEEQVLNKRAKDGLGVYARGTVVALWRRDGLQPEVGLSFLRLHSSNNTVFVLGVNGSLK